MTGIIATILYFFILLVWTLFAPPAHAEMRLNTAVSQENIYQTICVKGWTKKVRPGVPYTNFVKKQYMHAAGLDGVSPSHYELDHIIPLELGGHPYAPENLQLQPWTGPTGARAKDVVETWLKRQVCARRIKLADAQACIYNHWQQCKKEFAK